MRDMLHYPQSTNIAVVALNVYNNSANNKCIYIEGLGRCKYFIECTDNTVPEDKFSLSVIQMIKNLKNYPVSGISKSRKCVTLTHKSLCEMASRNWMY